jgi:hypothetical protein
MVRSEALKEAQRRYRLKIQHTKNYVEKLNSYKKKNYDNNREEILLKKRKKYRMEKSKIYKKTDKTLKELKEICKNNNLSNYSKYCKNDLIDFLKSYNIDF